MKIIKNTKKGGDDSTKVGTHRLVEERAPFGWGGKILIFGIPILVLGMMAVFFTVPLPSQARIVQSIVSFIVILAIYFFWNTFFGFTEKTVYARFGPFKYAIEFKDIQSVSVVKVPWWFGLGVRMNVFGGRILGFVTRKNQAVEIKKKNGFFTTVWLTTENPEEFAEKIRKKI